MSCPVVIRPRAELDVMEHAAFLSQDSPAVGQRFLESTAGVFAKLGQMPLLGREREFDDPRLAGLRSYLITHFENYVVFYLRTETGVDIIRVLHGAQDVEERLKE